MEERTLSPKFGISGTVRSPCFHGRLQLRIFQTSNGLLMTRPLYGLWMAREWLCGTFATKNQSSCMEDTCKKSMTSLSIQISLMCLLPWTMITLSTFSNLTRTTNDDWLFSDLFFILKVSFQSNLFIFVCYWKCNGIKHRLWHIKSN